MNPIKMPPEDNSGGFLGLLDQTSLAVIAALGVVGAALTALWRALTRLDRAEIAIRQAQGDIQELKKSMADLSIRVATREDTSRLEGALVDLRRTLDRWFFEGREKAEK